MPDNELGNELVPGSPDWWLVRLLNRLQSRRAGIARWTDYYAGKQPLAFASEKFRDAFGDRFPVFTSNFCSLVVDGTAERLEVAGFRFADKGGDKDVWELWQANEMDAASQLAHQEALIKGAAYALVEPVVEGFPVITIEDAAEAIVEVDPRRPRNRLAGLKAWTDSDGHLQVYLYLPDFIFKYRSERPTTQPAYGWPPRGATELTPLGEWTSVQVAQLQPLEVAGEDWPAVNQLGVVPLVELPNRPRLGVYGQSEIEPIQSNQDAVNKYRCDALIASEFAAFPQRYLLNYEPELDEDTKQPKEPFRAAIDRMWLVPPQDALEEGGTAPDLKIGQFPAASLEPYSQMIGLEVGHMSAISRLPYHYLLGTPQTIPPSGEMLKASEAGLVRKVGRAELFIGQGWEQVLRVCLRAMADPRADVAVAETIWRDEETRNEAVRTDAVVKLHGARIIDDELAWEMIGLTPTQAERLRERRLAAAKLAEAAGEPNPNEPPPANGAAAGTVVPAPTGPRMSAVPGGGARA